VAPFIGTGEKMKHEPAFPINDRLVERSRSRDRRCRALSAIPHTHECQAFVGIGHTTSTALVSAPASERYPMLGSPLFKR